MPYLNVNGILLSYREAGYGIPVVALHSSCNSSAQWGSLQNEMKTDFRFIAPDLRGYGNTDNWLHKEPKSLRQDVMLIDALIEKIGEPVHLIGHSYGGALALHLAKERPARFRSLTLIEPDVFHLLRGGSSFEQEMFEEIMLLGKTITEATVNGAPMPGLHRFIEYWNGPKAWDVLGAETRHALAKNISTVMYNYMATFRDDTPLREYQKIELPTHIFYGRETVKPTKMICDLLDQVIQSAKKTVISGAGHMLPNTHAREFNQFMGMIVRHEGQSSQNVAA